MEERKGKEETMERSFGRTEGGDGKGRKEKREGKERIEKRMNKEKDGQKKRRGKEKGQSGFHYI